MRSVATKRNKAYEKLYARAFAAGRMAGELAKPTPMVVTQRENPLNDNSPIQQAWHVPEGVCGFAWIIVRPGGSSFARWLKTEKDHRRDYYGGICIWVDDHGQSMARKQAHAEAFAKVLREAGINAHANSRMD
jgi:hypothetical protein